MEKITSWLWRENPSLPAREDAYYLDADNAQIVIVRGSGNPSESKERLDISPVLSQYEARGYSKLQTHSQHTYDFLKARGY